MLFTSWLFLKFFAIVLIGLWLLPTIRLRQLLILLASAYFYASWKPAYILVLAAPAVIDYFCAIRIENTDDPRSRRFWLIVSLVSNLGLLAYFKYTNFFIDAFSGILGTAPTHLSIVLPIGISFFVFKTLSYTIDVYRRELKACREWWRYAMFVSYFPELVAGPIVRASVFLPQLGRSLDFDWHRISLGLQMVLLGLTKKLLIADRLAMLVDPVFADPAVFSPLTVAQAVLAYSLQIYCDFSGYTDMAIGISKIIGFDLPENFNMPYTATSITDFWRRWHITLSLWLRDYLYIPLGGNRKSPARTYLNILLTMLLGGLWHGANWTFVFWGMLHGIALVLHRLWRRMLPATAQHSYFTSFLGWLITFLFVNLAWVLFRGKDFATALTIYRKLFLLDATGIAWNFLPLYLLLPLVIGAHLIGKVAQAGMLYPGSDTEQRNSNRFFTAIRSPLSGVFVFPPWPGFVGGFVIVTWLLILYLFATVNVNPFIYFQF